MAIQKETDLFFASFSYWRIDKKNPMIPLPLVTFKEATEKDSEIKGVATIKINLYSDRAHSLSDKPADTMNLDCCLMDFEALYHANPDNYLGCLYHCIKQLPEWGKCQDILEEGQIAIN